MARTRHIHKRMNQRGIQQVMLDLVKQFGVDNGDKIILNQQALKVAIAECKKVEKLMQKMESKGGLVLVEVDGVELTTYPLNSYKRSKAHIH
jgi:ASC-1-like (ASCH) protein